ncbi:DUF7343 domain-containing protein [Archaeoglobus sp.]
MKFRLLIPLFIFLIATVSVGGVEIYGKIYRWDTLDLVKDVIVEVKDGSVQRLVSDDGSYSFNLSPGNYTIIAKKGDYIAVENLTIRNTTRFDLILFPNLESIEDLPDFPEITDEEAEQGQLYYLPVAAIAGVVVAVLYILKRREKERERGRVMDESLQAVEPIPDDLPEDLVEVLEIIRRVGGRITQKELRKKLGYSEAKMSLIIADLERRGLVEKVKKGRGNIIFLRHAKSNQ